MSSPDWLSEAVLKPYRAQFAEAVELLSSPSPEKEPYKNQYAARTILQETSDDLLANHGDSEHSLALRGHLLSRVAMVSYDVEEPTDSQNVLEKALEIMHGCNDKGWVIIARMVCFNQLGIVWSSRGVVEKAKDFLQKSLSLYSDPERPTSIHDIDDLLSPNDADPVCEARKHALELLNTHTYYYLAQVYEKDGQPTKAGECCHITLTKQLELKEYKPVDWATNALTLSYHYIMNDRFSDAKAHLCAARFVLDRYRSDLDQKEIEKDEKEELEEAADIASARIERAWSKYSLVLLQRSQEKFLLEATDDGEEEMPVQDLESEREQELQLFEGLKCSFPGVETESVLQSSVPHAFVKDFEGARDIFLPGQRSARKAQEVFNLNDHCTDFTELNQDLSTMNKILVFFETDWDRRFKIHKRRVELLEMPLRELNPTHYMLVSRQLMFELGELYESLMDVKLDQFVAEGKTNDRFQMSKKVNPLVAKSLAYFMKYLNTFEDPTNFPTESRRACLVANFHMARLHDKYIVPEATTERLANILKTLDYFKVLVDYCEKCPEAIPEVEQELKISKEMVKLLPIKIQKTKMEIARAQQ